MKFLLLPPYRGVNKRICCYVKWIQNKLCTPLYQYWLGMPNGDSPCLLMYGKMYGSTLNRCTNLISLDTEDMSAA